jgi:hypothetical protein
LFIDHCEGFVSQDRQIKVFSGPTIGLTSQLKAAKMQIQRISVLTENIHSNDNHILGRTPVFEDSTVSSALPL